MSSNPLIQPLPEKLRLGLCCIVNVLRDKRIFNSRTTPRRTYTVKRAQELALKNIADLETMLKWNHENGIHVFRLSSDIFPHFTDPETEPYTMEFARDALIKAGEWARQYGQRITMHPGQFNQIATPTQSVFDKTVQDLSMHCQILDWMGVPVEDGIVNIHGGGVYGDKESTIRKWCDRFDDLPREVRRRLSIENCEKCYCVRDCLEIAHQVHIPVVFDSHHYTCYNHYHKEETQESPEDLMSEALETWWSRGGRPLCHVSSQREGARVGTHSDLIESLPDYFLQVPEFYQTGLDIDVEAKAKEVAIFDLYKRYDGIFA